jgi:hypothetical protein
MNGTALPIELIQHVRTSKYQSAARSRASTRLSPTGPLDCSARGCRASASSSTRAGKAARTYRTPVNLFRTGQGYLLALTFGSDADWVKNVLAADSFEVITQRRTYRLVDPKLFVDELRSQVPFIVRLILNRAKGQCPDIMPPGIIMVWSMDRPQLVIRFAIGWCMFWKAPATSG